MMKWTLGFAILLTASSAGCVAVVGSVLQQWMKTGDDDVILTDGLLFDVTAMSTIDCARQCSQNPECVTFTSTQTGAAESCRGHSSSAIVGGLNTSIQWTRVFPPNGAATSESVSSPAEETTMFNPSTSALDTLPPSELEKPCVDESDCNTGANFECFLGKCLCIPGYYYSLGSSVCVVDCDKTDLQSAFVKYPSSSMFLHNLESTSTETQEECKMLCLNLATDACRVYEYVEDTGQCNLQSQTPSDAPLSWRTGPGWDLYQRMCV